MKSIRNVLSSIMLLVTASVPLTVVAEVALAPVFGNGMVIQRGRPIPIWGRAETGAQVLAEMNGQRAEATADAAGDWRLELPPATAGGPFFITVTAGPDSVTVQDVLVGDVWLVAGDGLVDLYANSVPGGGDLLRQPRPRFRLLQWTRSSVTVPVRWTERPQHWRPASMEHGAAAFSGLAFFFGLELQQMLDEEDVPVGLIQASAANSLVESWIGRAALEADPELQPLIQAYDAAVAAFREAARGYTALFPDWVKGVDRAEREGTAYPPRPPLPDEPRSDPRKPCGYFNGMIAPLAPFPIRGVVWNHGRLNVPRAHQHRRLLPTLIQSWRQAWDDQDLPFLFLQLPSAPGQAADELQLRPSAWAELRESQQLAAGLPSTAMVVTLDLGTEANVVPELGRRLARAALAVAYDRDADWMQPVLDQVKIQENTVLLTFRNTGGALNNDGADNAVRGFAVAGDDRRFVRAEARVDGNSVTVSSPEVVQPVAVRYNWADQPPGRLAARGGLPVAPFRTDDWEWSTASR